MVCYGRWHDRQLPAAAEEGHAQRRRYLVNDVDRDFRLCCHAGREQHQRDAGPGAGPDADWQADHVE